MLLKKIGFGLAASAAVLAFAPAANATTYPVGSPNFTVDFAAVDASLVTASFKATNTTGAIDDSFTFTLPRNGVGSGNVSTSSSGSLSGIKITDVIINGTSYAALLGQSAAGSTFSVNNIAITAGVLNTIRILGTVTGTVGSYQGGATFQATAVPEAATWAMMLGGFGLMGAALRRRRVNVEFA